MSTQVAQFDIGQGEKAIGELVMEGKDSTLTLSSDRELDASQFALAISGRGGDGKLVSCVGCVPKGQSVAYDDGSEYHVLKLFPHYVASGSRALMPGIPVFTAVEFGTNDLAEICFAPGASGLLWQRDDVMRQVVGDDKVVHDGAVAVYFNGPIDIVDAGTVLGRIRVRQIPKASTGLPGGIGVSYNFLVRIDFNESVEFYEAERRMHVVRRFLSIVAGRSQVAKTFGLRHSEDKSEFFEPSSVVISCMAVAADVQSGALNWWDLPVHPAVRTEEFAEVMARWLQRDAERLHARVSFHEGFAASNKYTVGRLVAAANMFDLLPDEDSPVDVEVAADLAKAIDQAKLIMKGLPDTPQRNSVLQAFGRVKKASLTGRVLHRAEVLRSSLGPKLPEVEEVLKLAVKCRNHFVHGSPLSISAEALFPLMPFLTDALEFVFVTSDLIESGWNVERWAGAPTSQSHPLPRFLMGYCDRVAKLKEVGAIKSAEKLGD